MFLRQCARNYRCEAEQDRRDWAQREFA